MGSYTSRMVDTIEADSRSTTESDSDDSDSEMDYAEIFQRLVNRYINGQVSSHHEEYYPSRLPKIKHKPSTSQLDTSDYSFITKQASGLLSKRKLPGSDIATMILNREKGLCTYNSFSNANKCRIANWFLPNEMKKFCTYDGKVFCGNFSKNGNYFITASQDQHIRLYNTSTGQYQQIKTVRARDVGWSIIDLAFSPDQEHFVYSTWSTSLHICPVNGDEDKQEPLCLVKSGRRFCVFSVAFSSDGKEILGGANDGFLYIYDRHRNQRSLKIHAHEYDINSVSFADDSSHIIYSGGDDGLIKVWDRRTLDEESLPKPVGVLAGHMDGITFINSRGDGKHLISNSKDQSIKLWDVRVFSSDSAARNTLRAVHDQTWDYRWQGVPKKLYNKDQLEGDTSVMTYRGHIVTRTLIRCRFSPAETTGQRYIYTGCGSGRLIIYDALSGKIKREYRNHTACVRDVAWHPSRNEIMTSSWDGTVGQWYYAHKEPVQKKSNSKNEKYNRSENIRRSLRLAMKKQKERDSENNAQDT